MTNILLNTDSYKTSMFLQYPPKTTNVYSYIESRGGRYQDVVHFGPQAFIKEYLLKPFTKSDLNEAKEVGLDHGEPFNYDGWEHILNKHGGYLPLEIKSAPEGTPIPYHNATVSVENTDPLAYWLTTHIETSLLRGVWFPSTVATNSREIKKIILAALVKTGTPADISFKLHDFGARGCSSQETAMLGGMAHLVNFMGTDTIAGVLGARRYYNEPMAGFSIPAAEHSTITSWGRDNEVDAYRNMLTQFAKPGALVAVVSDSYDIFNAVTKLWGGELRQTVIDSGATLVVRPDSGDPATVVLEVAQRLDATFGSVRNSKGYKVLNSVRVIQGDGIDANSVKAILNALINAGFSADNIAFGMGGALLQAPQRDDQKFAMKASAALVDGNWVEVYKDPVTDQGKRSKKGRLALIQQHGIGTSGYATVSQDAAIVMRDTDLLRTIYKNGELLIDENFTAVRERAKV